jgi:hypothetical protein
VKQAEVLEKLHLMTKIFAKAGFELNPDKFETGQTIVYLGLIIDSVTMRMRIDATAVSAFVPQLLRYKEKILRRESISSSEIRHVAGKLGWYAEVTLSGRLRTRSWWLFLRHGNNMFEKTREKLLEDTDWWLEKMNAWKEGIGSSADLPILSAAEIKEHPDKVVVVQSDASGTDGFGYLWGTLGNATTV